MAFYYNTPTPDFVKDEMRRTGQKRTTIYMRLKAGWYKNLKWINPSVRRTFVTGEAP
jgi:hypothetical protein